MIKIMYIFCVFISVSWTSLAAADVANGRYVLVNKHSGKVLDVSGVSQSNGATVQQWTLGAGLNQRWDIVSLGDGYYSIRAAHSAKTLDVWGWNNSNGTEVKQYDYAGNANQQWDIVNNGGGYYRIISRLNGKALEVAGWGANNGVKIQMWDFGSTDNQLWSFQPVGASRFSKTAFEITGDMDAGWNLGNTLDSIGGETNWGNPFTERYMIDAIAKRGFKTLRIPVTWNDNLYGGNSYLIQPVWMDRVEKIVNYGLDNGMYVIINVHHEAWVKPTTADKNVTAAHTKAIWSQIATRFKNYNQYLIFETFNEPRSHYGTSLEWTGTPENYSVINELNSVALAAIRATGGSNTNRMIMIPGYAASPWNTQTDHLTVPNDAMVAISTHGYIPYDFSESENGPKIFSQKEKDLVDYVFNELNKKYISKGVPVVMGEWGTSDKGNTSERIAYAGYYAKKATSINIPTIVWDNNALGGNGHNYRLYDRAGNFWPFGNIADAIISNSK